MKKTIVKSILFLCITGLINMMLPGADFPVYASTHNYGDAQTWEDPLAWTGGVPGGGDEANIKWNIAVGKQEADFSISPGNYSVGTLNIDSPWVGYNTSLNMYDSTITINTGGTWAYGSFNGFWGNGAVKNYGLLNLIDDPAVGSATTLHRVMNGTIFNNYGTMTHTGSGQFKLQGTGSTFNNYGTYDLQSDANIYQSGYGETTHNYGTITKTGGTSSRITTMLDNQGSVESHSGTLYANTTSHVSGNTLSGGRWVAGSNSTLQISATSGSDRIETNNAQIVLSGNGSEFGVVNTSSQVFTSIDDSLNNNQGSFNISGGRQFTTAGNFTNSGTLTIDASSAFIVADGFSFSQTSSGIMNGTGSFFGDLESSGTIAPGHSPGTLTIYGDFNQSATGLLDMEIAGLNDYDILDIFGTASLGGDLSVTFLNGYTPETGDIFNILWADSITGIFDTSDEFKDLFNITYNNWDDATSRFFVQLEYINGTSTPGSPVPEPGTFLLFGIGLLGLASMTRKKR